ncbi:cell division protein FtsQ/DivIB [Paenibacillus sp. FSL H7-0331]|uniref:cell division protein FtsQ/DivIB n=1 Tax=Paenibacillus sp. FSL H7-0331 TaxID=1920421 RepID=UPI00096FE76A|nr:FtsQ-type POTRA domain-containing protein [Paenibacillus sp. FSL H7-0331]OMF20970.1 cell division protein FtsQ [Paenibacillus sp. FSL H7-0331]
MQAEERLPVIKKPKVRGRGSKRLLVFLFLFFITLLCVLFFQSSLSKITKIEIEGQELLAPEAIGQAITVKNGDHFFSQSSATIAKQVRALKMVESAEVSKHFPGLIHIQVHEFPKVAYQFDPNNQPQAILADGSVVSISTQTNFVLDKPILSGWADSDPLKLKLCQVIASLDPSYLADISEIKPDPTESYPDRIKMYTRSKFEVITVISYLPDKLQYLDSYIANLKENKINTGVLKLLEADTHAPFDTPADASKSGSKAAAGKDTSKTDKKTQSITPAPNDSKKDVPKDTQKRP